MSAKVSQFDVIVVGAGMMGSAAARHLADMGVNVALIGPEEPTQKHTHSGVFASHYDQARITRKLDSNIDWSRMSAASIKRYSEIEKSGGHQFFHPVGSIMAGPETGKGKDFILDAKRVGDAEAIPHTALRDAELRGRFPYFYFPDGILALYEQSGAGWINPRCHVAAEIGAAQKKGASVYRCDVSQIIHKSDHSVVICSDGAHFGGAKVIIACGAFSGAADLLLEPIPMKVYARTVAFFELDKETITRLNGMPSVVYIPPDLSCDPYILPPVKYQDGKTYIKIGGDPKDVELETQGDIKDWFRGNGDENVGQFLADQLLKLMPDLRYRSISFGSCVTSYTATGKPLIYPQSERLIALTGGNGAAAKCADELGRLAAKLATGTSLSCETYETSFDA